MSKSDHYFQFPIGAIRFGRPYEDVSHALASQRLNRIFGYCIVETGIAFRRKLNDEAIDAIIDSSDNRAPNQSEFSDHERNVLVGMHVLGIHFTDGNFVSNEVYVEEWEFMQRYRKGKKLRLKVDYMFQYRDGKTDWTWREFAILCGVYAGIGSAASKRLTFDYIGCLSMGYSSFAQAKEANAMLPEMHVVRYTVRKLANRGFFTYLSPNKRHNFYSKSLNVGGLTRHIIETEKNSREEERRKANELLREHFAKLEKKPKTVDTESRRQTTLKLLKQLEGA